MHPVPLQVADVDDLAALDPHPGQRHPGSVQVGHGGLARGAHAPDEHRDVRPAQDAHLGGRSAGRACRASARRRCGTRGSLTARVDQPAQHLGSASAGVATEDLLGARPWRSRCEQDVPVPVVDGRRGRAARRRAVSSPRALAAARARRASASSSEAQQPPGQLAAARARAASRRAAASRSAARDPRDGRVGGQGRRRPRREVRPPSGSVARRRVGRARRTPP